MTKDEKRLLDSLDKLSKKLSKKAESAKFKKRRDNLYFQSNEIFLAMTRIEKSIKHKL